VGPVWVDVALVCRATRVATTLIEVCGPGAYAINHFGRANLPEPITAFRPARRWH
jgi:hypothetical protein